jgi:hypothetical protein
MAKGQSFLNAPDKTSRGEIRHLNVVITEPDNDNNVLVVPVCTYREKDGKPFSGQDNSCLLPPGCHPFIKVRSYIKYSHALSMSLIDIFNGLHNGKFIKKEDFDRSIVHDMQRGAEESVFLPEKLKRFFEYFL